MDTRNVVAVLHAHLERRQPHYASGVERVNAPPAHNARRLATDRERRVAAISRRASQDRTSVAHVCLSSARTTTTRDSTDYLSKDELQCNRVGRMNDPRLNERVRLQSPRRERCKQQRYRVAEQMTPQQHNARSRNRVACRHLGVVSAPRPTNWRTVTRSNAMRLTAGVAFSLSAPPAANSALNTRCANNKCAICLTQRGTGSRRATCTLRT